ncbi:MAG: hypothetical protein AB7O24_18145 [Kofleriaceae bacterium]
MTESQRDLKAFMAIAQASAVEEAKLMPTTPDIKKRAHALAEMARDRLASMAREERAKRPSNVVSGAIRAAIQAMNPAQVIARLSELRVLHPGMSFAHLDYEDMTEEDLRSALEDAESLVERGD